MEGREPPTPAERAEALLAQGLVALNRGALRDAERAAREAREVALENGLGRELGQASGLPVCERFQGRDLSVARYVPERETDRAGSMG